MKTANKAHQISHSQRLYTTAEVAAILAVSLQTVQNWVRDG